MYFLYMRRWTASRRVHRLHPVRHVIINIGFDVIDGHSIDGTNKNPQRFVVHELLFGRYIIINPLDIVVLTN